MKELEQHYPEIGKVIYKRHPRAKRLIMRMDSHSRVRITVPGQVSMRAAEKFLQKNHNWVRDRQKAIAQQHFAPDKPYRTREHSLRMQPQHREGIRIMVAQNEIHVCYPAQMPHTAEPVQEAVQKGIISALRKEAHAYLPGRTVELAHAHGLKYAGLRIKNLKSKWGSCSSANNINLNLHLMRLPGPLIDYVILHELAHTKHKNHQQAFWLLLNRLIGGNAREMDKALKQYHPGIF